jgi:hypothetical protein
MRDGNKPTHKTRELLEIALYVLRGKCGFIRHRSPEWRLTPMCAQSQPYSEFRHLCSGLLLNHDPSSTWVVVMTGYSLYLDAAGHPSDQPHVVVAGFIATESAWLNFEPEWAEALRRNGLGPVFHMTDFEKNFRDSPKHDDILRDLIQVIGTHASASICSTVPMDDYRNVNEHYILEEGIGKPYGLVARGAYMSACLWQQKYGRPGKILTFVESGTLHEGDMRKCFKRDGFDEPIPVDKKHPSAQAADLFAWEVANQKKTFVIRPTLQFIADTFIYPYRHNGSSFSRRKMRERAEALGVLRRKDVPDGMPIVFHTEPKNPRKRQIK